MVHTIQETSPEELGPLPEGIERWGAEILEDGEIVGRIRLSKGLGEVFGHDTEYWGKEPAGAARLWFRARRKAREWGARAVNIHVDEYTDPKIVEFWTRLGFKPAMIVYRGDI